MEAGAEVPSRHCVAEGIGGSSTGAPHSSSQPPNSGVKDPMRDLCAQVNVRWNSGATEPNAPIICIVCGREGHPCCGLRYWTTLRAAWLKASEEEVACVPNSFEDPGPLQLARAGLTLPIRDLN